MNESIIHGYVLDGTGRGTKITGEAPPPDAARPTWLHFDRAADAFHSWLQDHSALETSTQSALLSEEARPRAQLRADGLLLILRAVSSKEDEHGRAGLASLRMWLEEGRVVSCRQRHIVSTEAIVSGLSAGTGPRSVPALLIELVDDILDQLDDLSDALELRLVAMERAAGEAGPIDSRALAALRQELLSHLRHLSPQHTALERVANAKLSWLRAPDRAALHECANRALHAAEEFVSMRDRAQVVHDEITARDAATLNSRLYVLTVITAIFLPLSLLTGLLGINVGGIPGADSSLGFGLACAVLIGLGIAEYLLLRRLKWM